MKQNTKRYVTRAADGSIGLCSHPPHENRLSFARNSLHLRFVGQMHVAHASSYAVINAVRAY